MRQLNGNGSNGFAPKDILSHYINIRKFSYYIPELTCPYKSFQSSGVFFRKPPNTVNILAMNPLESPPCKRAHLDACTTHARRTVVKRNRTKTGYIIVVTLPCQTSETTHGFGLYDRARCLGCLWLALPSRVLGLEFRVWGLQVWV
jgi:hypothetical protein